MARACKKRRTVSRAGQERDDQSLQEKEILSFLSSLKTMLAQSDRNTRRHKEGIEDLREQMRQLEAKLRTHELAQEAELPQAKALELALDATSSAFTNTNGNHHAAADLRGAIAEFYRTSDYTPQALSEVVNNIYSLEIEPRVPQGGAALTVS